jgi:hypothetical protein
MSPPRPPRELDRPATETAAGPTVVYGKNPQPWVIAALFSGELRRLPVPYIVYRLISAGSPRVD